MTKEQKSYVVRAPLIGLAALIGLVSLSAGWAYVPLAPAKLEVSLACAALMLAVVLLVFMEFRRAGALVRVTALAGCVWLSFLFLQTLGEIASR